MRGDASTTRALHGNPRRRRRERAGARAGARVGDVRTAPLPGQRRRRGRGRAHGVRGRRGLRGLAGRALQERRQRPPMADAGAGGPGRVLQRHPRRPGQPRDDIRRGNSQRLDPDLPHGRRRRDVVAAPDDFRQLLPVLRRGRVRGRGARGLRDPSPADGRRGPDLAGRAESLHGTLPPDDRARRRVLRLRTDARFQEHQRGHHVDGRREPAALRRHECAARGSVERVRLRGGRRPSRRRRTDLRRRLSQHERGKHVDREQPLGRLRHGPRHRSGLPRAGVRVRRIPRRAASRGAGRTRASTGARTGRTFSSRPSARSASRSPTAAARSMPPRRSVSTRSRAPEARPRARRTTRRCVSTAADFASRRSGPSPTRRAARDTRSR